MRRVGIFSVVSALTCVLTAAIGLASANATENKAEWAVNEGAGLVKLTKAEGLSEAITTKQTGLSSRRLEQVSPSNAIKSRSSAKVKSPGKRKLRLSRSFLKAAK
jgi:hypothetical protein